MLTKEELKQGVAKLLTDLRTRQGLSKAKMADKLGVDAHTWRSWESGESTPNIVDFISAFEQSGEPMLRPILNFLYPDTYMEEDNVEQQRKAIVDFFANQASDHMIRVWAFLNHGGHGSNIAPQVEEFCALDHLPMEHRYFVAEQIYVYYKMALHRGELVATDEVMPDMDVWIDGLKQGQRAAFTKLNSYTTIGGQK